MTPTADATRGSERIVWVLISAFLCLCLFALVTPIGAVGGSAQSADDPTLNTEIDRSQQSAEGASNGQADSAQRFTISASGDILIHQRVAEAATTPAGFAFENLFTPISSVIQNADLAICHLEVPLSATDQDLAYGGSADGGAFRSPMQLADALVTTGFDSCSVASNHSYDSGESSVLSTVDQLQRVGLSHVGIASGAEQAERLWQFPIGDTVVGHLSYTYGLNGRDNADVPAHHVARIDEATILADAARQRAAGSTFVVVSIHWGDEFTTTLNQQQQNLGPRLIASNDIDLIIGHHAHVPQQIDTFDGGVVAYGLGNLLSNQSSSAPECPTLCPLESQDGALVDFVVERATDGTTAIVDTIVHPTWVDVGTTWQVLLADSAPPAGTGADVSTLQASANRTRETLGIS